MTAADYVCGAAHRIPRVWVGLRSQVGSALARRDRVQKFRSNESRVRRSCPTFPWQTRLFYTEIPAKTPPSPSNDRARVRRVTLHSSGLIDFWIVPGYARLERKLNEAIVYGWMLITYTAQRQLFKLIGTRK